MFSIFWSAVILIHVETKCLSLPANLFVVRLTCVRFELSSCSSSPSASSEVEGSLEV